MSDVIKKANDKGFGYAFTLQAINYSAQHRKIIRNNIAEILNEESKVVIRRNNSVVDFKVNEEDIKKWKSNINKRCGLFS